MYLLFILLNILIFLSTLVSTSNGEDIVCHHDPNHHEQEGKFLADGGIILIVIFLGQSFWGLSRVCEHYFCSSLRVLCEEYKIPDHVAGATFMAVGSSSADLIISIISLFVFKSSIGLGTIIGSEIFNHLVISGACAMSAKNPLKLNGTILTRDCCTYAMTLLMLILVLHNGSFKPTEYQHCLAVYWYHGLIMIICNVIYTIFIVYFDDIMLYFQQKNIGSSDGKVTDEIIINPITIDYTSNKINNHSIELNSKNSIELNSIETAELDIKCEEIIEKEIQKNYIENIIYYIVLPFFFLISWTIPDTNIPKNRKYYWVAIFLSVIWMGLLAEALLFCIDEIGDLLKINSTLVGITIGACGASMPTFWSSIVVARRDQGDMAISNALGANVFSVLMGLGLPWFTYPLYLGTPYYIEDDGIIPLTIMLSGTLFLYWLIIAAYDYYLHYWMGLLFLFVYLVIILVCILFFFKNSSG